MHESPRVPSSSGQHRLLNQHKAQRRQDTVVTGYRRLRGELQTEDKVLTLCSHQDGSEWSEPTQLARELGPHTYIGVDLDERIIDENEAVLPDLTWVHGNITDAADMFPDAKLVNLDFCNLVDVFFKGNIRERLYTGSRYSFQRSKEEVVALIKDKPGTLPKVLDTLNDDAVVFVNVCSKTVRRGDFTEDVPIFVDALTKVKGWKPVGVLSGASRNLALPGRGPWARYYTYESNIKESDPTKKGQTSEFTTFCLVKSAK